MNSQTIPQSLVPQPQPVRRLHQKQLLFHLKWVRLYPWCRSRTHGCHCHSQPVHPLLGEAWKPQHQTARSGQQSEFLSVCIWKLSSITSTLYTLDIMNVFYNLGHGHWGGWEWHTGPQHEETQEWRSQVTRPIFILVIIFSTPWRHLTPLQPHL